MWLSLLGGWNGSSILQSMQVSFFLSLATDASYLGMGAFFDGDWFSIPWPSAVSGCNIAILELFAVYAALISWSERLCDKQVVMYTDNEAFVQVWESGSSKNESIMVLVRAIFFASARSNLSLVLRHVPGYRKVFADLLSRLQVSRFRAVCPDAASLPAKVPSSIWECFNKVL